MRDFKRIFARKRTVLLWAAAVVVAVGGGTAAVAASGPDRDVLTQQDVSNQLDDSSTAPSGRPSTRDPSSGATPPPPDEGDWVHVSRGGAVLVSCDGTSVYLHSWSPKPGYRADHVTRGPGQRASVEFESDSADDVTVTVTCDSSGRPHFNAVADPDDHGGDDDRGRDDDNSGPGGGGDDNSGRDHPEDD